MLGRILLTLDSLGLLFGAVLADWNETHVFNPRWPPHAKFHNAQTISLSVILGCATLYYTWRPVVGGGGTAMTAEMAADSLRTAAFTGSIYWLAGLVSPLFPGSNGLDPEFGGPGFPQGKLFAAFAGLGLAGWLLEGR